jgi:hypothetical protein
MVMEEWTEEEIRMFQEMLDRCSEDTGISIWDYMPEIT